MNFIIEYFILGLVLLLLLASISFLYLLLSLESTFYIIQCSKMSLFDYAYNNLLLQILIVNSILKPKIL